MFVRIHDIVGHFQGLLKIRIARCLPKAVTGEFIPLGGPAFLQIETLRGFSLSTDIT
jgi:hypothetical protein